MKSRYLLPLFLVPVLAGATEPLKMMAVDPIGVTRDIYYENQNGYAITEGDIILAHKHNANIVQASAIPNVGGARWPEATLPFIISPDLPQESVQSLKEAMLIWETKTRIKFVEVNEQNEDQYPDYVLLLPAPGTTCASEVGKIGGKQEIVLAPRCNTMNIVHELGHAIGLWHEQSRQDRDQYIQIIWDNIEESHQYNFNQHLTDGIDYGPYNYDSIMHYGAYAFSKNQEKTIIPLQEGANIGQRDHLSEGDIAAIAEMYPLA